MRAWRADPDLQRVLQTWERIEPGPQPRNGSSPVVGNLHLTSLAGLSLMVALAAVYGTGALFGDLRPAHFFTGFLVLPLLLLKLLSTGWRALRYYLRHRMYHAAGPPWLLPRLLAVPLVLVTVIAMVSGVILWGQGTSRGTWASVHTDAVVVLVLLLGIHVVVHLRRAIGAVAAQPAAVPSMGRGILVVIVLLAGIVLALVLNRIEPAWHENPRQHREAAASQRLVTATGACEAHTLY